jgi:hypothetical protein
MDTEHRLRLFLGIMLVNIGQQAAHSNDSLPAGNWLL